MRSPTPELDVLLTMLAEAYEKKAWHGPNLRGALRGVSAKQASWRPAPGRHNIRELAVHAAYWKYAVRRRITGEKRGGFAFDGSNWFERGTDENEASWKWDLALLAAEHRALLAAIEGLTATDTKDTRRWEYLMRQIRGVAAHDLYHAGQIQLLKRLCPAG
jgi:hypothetical protein